jgi:glutamate-ammonia-ligase adenylyltransferase
MDRAIMTAETRILTQFLNLPAFCALPAVLQTQVEHAFLSLAADHDLLIQHPRLFADLPQVLAASDFVANALVTFPALCQDLVISGDLLTAYPRMAHHYYLAQLQHHCATCGQESELALRLRYVRAREMVRIAWRDIVGAATLTETLANLTACADAIVRYALSRLTAWYQLRYGIPVSENQKPQQLIVIALGKLGGGELNFSSDIDIVFCYGELGWVHGGEHGLSNDDFFTRLARALIKLLNDMTSVGFVYRVDVRLRPHGQAGPLVLSFSALEHYLLEQGRDWERFAYIKARILTGEKNQRKQLLHIIHAFVYRRYLDYGTLQALRELNCIVTRQFKISEVTNDIKRGWGGIRELEWFVQVFQLIHGGRQSKLRIPGTRRALERLGLLHHLTAEKVRACKEAYHFLRKVEHALQMRRDEQTYQLPMTEVAQAQVLVSLGMTNWRELEEQLKYHTGIVAGYFNRLIAKPRARHELLHKTQESSESSAATALTNSQRYRHLSAVAKERFLRVLPMLLQEVAATPDPEQTLLRIINLIEAVMARSTYLALLWENPEGLHFIVLLVSQSAWVSEQLVAYPQHLVDLITWMQTPSIASEQDLRSAWAQEWLDVPEDDVDGQMNALRTFQHAQILKIAASELVSELPASACSAGLATVADLVLEEVYWQANLYFQQRLKSAVPTRFAIIVYGRLGSREMNYHSDLDLVFLHDDDGCDVETDSGKRLTEAEFYARLGQRMIHLLATRTAAGVLYNVDTRLRPSGRAGLLVSHINAFTAYQQQEAWVWEHQALIKARGCCGDLSLLTQFEHIRTHTLAQPRDHDLIATEISAMADKMRENQLTAQPEQFDLRLSPGGCLDIEFLTQYAVLCYAHQEATLLTPRDTIGLLKELAAKQLISATDATDLINSYSFYQQQLHNCALTKSSTTVSQASVGDYPRRVISIWQRYFNGK